MVKFYNGLPTESVEFYFHRYSKCNWSQALGHLLQLTLLWVASIFRDVFWPQLFCDCNSVSPSILIVAFLQCENTFSEHNSTKHIHVCVHSSSLHKQNSRYLYRLAILCGSFTTISVLLPRERTDPSPHTAEKQCIHHFSIKWKERKCDAHAAQIRNAGKQVPAIKPHLYSRGIILHCSWLECAAAAWPNWQLECQTQCLHSAGCLFLGSTKNDWLSSQKPSPTLAHRPWGFPAWLWQSRWEEFANSGVERKRE